jgi:hypothetical protein
VPGTVPKGDLYFQIINDADPSEYNFSAPFQVQGASFSSPDSTSSSSTSTSTSGTTPQIPSGTDQSVSAFTGGAVPFKVQGGMAAAIFAAGGILL